MRCHVCEGHSCRFMPSKSVPEEEKMIGLLLPDYSGIATIQMLWDWMDSSIVPTFTVSEPRVLLSHRLLGKVRLRQLRVRGRTCDMREVSWFLRFLARHYFLIGPRNK